MVAELKKAWRNDAVAKVTGRVRYTDDIKAYGMLHAVPVYTDYVHAVIRDIDTTSAANAEGVVIVITAADVPGSTAFGQIIKDYRMFADDKIRCTGDVIAVVVAETRKQALDASKLITVKVDELPVLSDPREAMKNDAVLVHEDHGSNITNHHKVRRGNLEKGFSESDCIIEKEFTTSHIEHAYLEPESAFCIPRSDGVMEVYGSMQHPFSTRRFVAVLLGIDLSEIEVKTVPIGGGFGGKDDTAAIVCARTALAAHLTNRPVRMTYDREWSMRESYKRHAYRVKYKMGFSKDGLIKVAKIDAIADGGAYCSVTPWVTWRSTVQCCGPYCVDNVECDIYGVYTNNVFSGAMRGFGSPTMNFIVEQVIDMAAERIGISSIDLRRKNMVSDGATTITGQVLNNHTVSMNQVLTKIVGESGYTDKLQKCSRGADDNDEMYGIGLAMSYRGMSLGAEGMDFNSAIINVQFDGSILMEVAIHENGQGSETTMIMLLAEQLGVSPDRIRYRMPSTSNIPDGGTTVASRGTLMGGGALVNAANVLKRRMSHLLATKLNCEPEDVIFKDDVLSNKNGSETLTFDDAMHELFLMQEYAYAFASFKAPDVSWDEETGQGNAYFTWVYGCQAVELTVNRKTGKVTLLNAYAAHDVGRAINPTGVLGQFYGGMAMGMGYALHEKVEMEGGIIKNLNFNKYRIPRARDIPDMHAFIIENYDPNSPSGAKGVGEPTTELMAPAIANAIYNATGKRYFDAPIKVNT